MSLVFTRAAATLIPSRKFVVVIGADGAWSRVLPLLPPTRPTYGGVTFVEGYLVLEAYGDATPQENAKTYRPKGRPSHSAIIAQRNSGGVVSICGVVRPPRRVQRHGRCGVARYAGAPRGRVVVWAQVKHRAGLATPRIFDNTVSRRWRNLAVTDGRC